MRKENDEMKKYLALILALMFVFMFCACGSGETEDPVESADPTESTEPGTDDPVQSEEPSVPDVEDPSLEELGVGDDDDDDDDDNSIGDDDDTPSSPKSQSKEALEAELGIALPDPAGATDIAWARIAGDDPIAQLTFKLDGKEFCLRVQETGEFKDISEMTFTNPQTDDTNEDYVMKLEGSNGVITWFVDGFSYAIKSSAVSSFDDLELAYGAVNA